MKPFGFGLKKGLKRGLKGEEFKGGVLRGIKTPFKPNLKTYRFQFSFKEGV